MAVRKPPARKGVTRSRTVVKEKVDPIAEVRDDIIAIEHKRSEVKRLNDEVKVHQDRVNQAFARAKRKSTKVEVPGDGTYNVTYVEGSSIVLDEQKLKKRIGAALWNKVTTRVLDRKKLEAFIASQEIPATTVAACSDEIPRAPFVKVVKKSA